MKKYEVILTSCVNMARDMYEDSPETKEYRFTIEANSGPEAVDIAKEIHPLSVWESDWDEA